MIKRFGRNQRRKLREAVAAEKERADYWQHWAEKYRSDAVALRGRLNRWAEDVVRLMGPDSAFNEQVRRVTVEDVFSFGGRIRLAPVEPMPIAPLSAPVSMASVTTVIEALIWRLHVSRDEFRNLIRIELENRYAEPVGYVLSGEHIWTARDERYLAERFAREMVALRNRSNKRRAA